MTYIFLKLQKYGLINIVLMKKCWKKVHTNVVYFALIWKDKHCFDAVAAK